MQSACTDCHLCFVWLSHVFPYSVINSMIFRKVIENKMRVLIFSTKFFPETLLILRRTELYIRNVYKSSCEIPIIRVRFNET